MSDIEEKMPEETPETVTPAEKETPVKEEASAVKEAPSGEDASVVEETSAEKDTPVQEETPSEEESFAKIESPVKEESLGGEETPAQEENPAEKETSSEKAAPAEEKTASETTGSPSEPAKTGGAETTAAPDAASPEEPGPHAEKPHKKKKHRRLNPLLICLLVILAAFLAAGIYLTDYFARENARLQNTLETERFINSANESIGSVRREMTEKRLAEELSAEELRTLRSEITASALEKNSEGLLTLVNSWNYIDENFTPELVAVDEAGHEFDYRAAGDLLCMIADCSEAGGYPVIVSTYRTVEYQQQLFDDKVLRVIYSTGIWAEDAPDYAAREVARPGTSEHHLGLAVDISDEFITDLTYWQDYTVTQQWLAAHCWEYGFIRRYPANTTEITGIIYEPWHYRYVGRAAAQEIYESGVTLEEYLGRVNQGE